MSKTDSYFLLGTGRRFYPFAPDPDSINIQDIAQALSNLCRFNGQVVQFYSVAEHSVLCSRLVSPENALCALLHDATEAYVGDMIRPIKNHIPDFEAMEQGVWEVIAGVYGLPFTLPAEVKWADNAMLKAEAYDLLKPFETPKFPYITEDRPEGVRVYHPASGVYPMTPTAACEAFLSRYLELT